MNGTRAIKLHKIFKRHKFTDQETDQIIEFVENKNGELLTKKDLELGIAPLKRDINWIKWVLGIIVALLLWFAGGMHSLQKDMTELKADIRELNKKSDSVMQKPE